MSEELQSTACPACGWPALAGSRRCPFCREQLPRPRRAARRRPSDLLGWLAVAWLLVSLPAVLLSLALVGLPLGVMAVVVALAPAFAVWLLHQRRAMRIGRFGARVRGIRPAPPAPPRHRPSNSSDTSEDARRR